MGLLRRIFGGSSSSRYFNEANDHWKIIQTAGPSMNGEFIAGELLEVIRFCQLALDNERNNGDAYVLLANALSNASMLARTSDAAEQLSKLALGTLFEWESGQYWTRNKLAAGNVRVMVRQRVNAFIDATDTDTGQAEGYEEIGSRYGRWPISTSSYGAIENMVLLPMAPTTVKIAEMYMSTMDALDESDLPKLTNGLPLVIEGCQAAIRSEPEDRMLHLILSHSLIMASASVGYQKLAFTLVAEAAVAFTKSQTIANASRWRDDYQVMAERIHGHILTEFERYPLLRGRSVHQVGSIQTSGSEHIYSSLPSMIRSAVGLSDDPTDTDLGQH